MTVKGLMIKRKTCGRAKPRSEASLGASGPKSQCRTDAELARAKRKSQIDSLIDEEFKILAIAHPEECPKKPGATNRG